MSLSWEDREWLQTQFNQMFDYQTALLNELLQTRRDVEQMTPELQGIIDEVARNTDVASSAKQLLGQLFDFVQAHINDPAALQGALDQLRSNDDGLVDAVTANTPAAPPTGGDTTGGTTGDTTGGGTTPPVS